MSREIGRVQCGRGRHTLAIVTADHLGDRVATVRTLVMSRAGVFTDEQTFLAADQPQDAAMTLWVDCVCACSKAWSIDVAALLRGESIRPRAVRPPDEYPALYHREK